MESLPSKRANRYPQWGEVEKRATRGMARDDHVSSLRLCN